MKKLISFVALFFSSGFFSGFVPGKITGKPGKGGGLAGSIIALIAQIILVCRGASWVQNAWLCLIAVGIGLVAVQPGESVLLKWYGKRSRHTGEVVSSDFNETNIDEIAGQFIAGMAAFTAQDS
jgi:phosphatidylglycerophosphatase A